MSQAMSIATCLWKFVAALNGTPLSVFFCHCLCPSALASHGLSNVHCNLYLEVCRSPQQHTSFFHRKMCSSALASHGPSNVHCNLSVETYHSPQQHTESVCCICCKYNISRSSTPSSFPTNAVQFRGRHHTPCCTARRSYLLPFF